MSNNRNMKQDEDNEVFFTDINAYNALHLGESMSEMAKKMSDNRKIKQDETDEEVFFTDINAYNAMHLGESISAIARKREETHPREKSLRQWLTKGGKKTTDDTKAKPSRDPERFSYQKDETIEQWFLE